MDPADVKRIEDKLDTLLAFMKRLEPYLPLLEKMANSPMLRWGGLTNREKK
jgi:hypothetical protein